MDHTEIGDRRKGMADSARISGRKDPIMDSAEISGKDDSVVKLHMQVVGPSTAKRGPSSGACSWLPLRGTQDRNKGDPSPVQGRRAV